MALIDDLLARSGKTRADINIRSRLGVSLSAEGVPDSDEVQRVLNLPRRPVFDPDFVQEMSELLRLPGSTATLRPLQAEALFELGDNGDRPMLFGPIPVGEGKTLITALAPVVLGYERALLLIPKTLLAKTQSDFDDLRKDWPVPDIELLSYERISRSEDVDTLLDFPHALLMADEAHKLRNPGAAVTRKVKRFIESYEPQVVLLSGTMMRDMRTLWHLLQWTHGPGRAPIPNTMRETEQWARAIENQGDLKTSLAPGALSMLGESQPELAAGYFAHVRGSRGVVAGNVSSVAASLRLRVESPPLPPKVAEVVKLLQDMRVRPDGVELEDAQLVDTEFQESVGFWYGWTKAPPERWMKARRAWYRLVRQVLDQHLPGLDSPDQVMRQLGRTTVEGVEWRAVRGSFRPQQETNWLTHDIVAELVGSCSAEPTLIWTDYNAVGESIEQRYGIPFYREGQKTAGGSPLKHAQRHTIVVSMHSCREGANLQQWQHNLIITPPTSEEWWQQMLGRTHRSGQDADEVFVRVYAPTERARARVMAARAEAQRLTNATKEPRKLALADLEQE